MTILKWSIGLAVLAVVGLPVLIIMLLAVVATIGSQANSEFETQSINPPITQVSQPVDQQSLNAVEIASK